MSATTADIPLTANGAASAPYADEKVDPSLGQTANYGGHAEPSGFAASPIHGADSSNGFVAPSEPTLAAHEKIGSLDPASIHEPTTTTTTTIM
jgi:hypothetical protein